MSPGLDPPKTDAELLSMWESQQSRRKTPVQFDHRVNVEPRNDATGVVVRMALVLDYNWPIRLRIPWSALVSDNAKMRAALTKSRKPTVVLTSAYRAAKKTIGALARDAMDGRTPANFPLALVARVWVPDNRTHDVVNFSKALHDALKGTVFTDDRWLYDSRWIRAGVDVDAPRAEIAITPLKP